jgi:hypothetical protein
MPASYAEAVSTPKFVAKSETRNSREPKSKTQNSREPKSKKKVDFSKSAKAEILDVGKRARDLGLVNAEMSRSKIQNLAKNFHLEVVSGQMIKVGALTATIV